MLDGIQDVSQGFQRKEAARPHIIGISMDAVEFSNLRWEQVLKTLNGSGATLHMLSLGMPSASMADEMRNLNQTIAEGTKDTGGRRDLVLATSGIPEALLRVADDLLNEYVVTYGRPERLIPPEKLQVTVSKPDVTVRARTRLAGR